MLFAPLAIALGENQTGDGGKLLSQNLAPKAHLTFRLKLFVFSV
jgi:hypothetical protein